MMKSRRGRYRWNDRGILKPAVPSDETAQPTGEEVCPACRGKGQIGGEECPQCRGSGKAVDAIGER